MCAVELDDAALGERVRAGDDSAFALLYERYAPRLYDFAARLVRDHAAAEDLVQTAFTRAYERRTELREPAKVKSWLFTTLHHLAINHLERRPVVPIDDEWDLAAPGPGPEEEAAARESATLVWDAAASLEPRQYAALDLSVRQGLSTPEVAQVLGLPVAHAAVVVNRARDALGNAVRYLMVARRRDHCARLAELVPAGVQALTPQQRVVVDHHMRHCDACQVMARRLTAPAEMLGALAPLPLPAHMARWQGPSGGQTLTAARVHAGSPRSATNASGRLGAWLGGHVWATVAIVALVVAGTVGGTWLALQRRAATPPVAGHAASAAAWRIDATSQQPGGLAGLACSSALSCTAVGAATAGASSMPLVMHWDGARWTVQSTPGVDGGALSSISCPEPASCVAVGQRVVDSNTTATLALRWDGTRWAVQTTPDPPGATDSELHAIACASASACTAVGYYLSPSLGVQVTLAERWDGAAWAIEPTPNPADASQSTLAGVSCARVDACLAVGAFTSSAGGGTLAERWDGSTWAIQSTPNGAGGSDSSLAAVSCTSESACTAVGGSGALELAERWDGAKWSVEKTPKPSGTYAHIQATLNGVACSSTGDCTAVGEFIDTPGAGSRAPWKALAMRWNGSSWAIESAAIPPSAVVSILSVVACTTVSSCVAVGNFAEASLVTEALTERE